MQISASIESLNNLKRHQAQNSTLLSIAGDINILKHGLVPYLDRIRDVPSLALTCHYLYTTIYSSELADIWNSSAIDVCIDEGCQFGCGRVHIKPSKALSMISRAPIEQLRMHLAFEKIEYLLASIVAKGAVKRLHLRFRVDEKSISNYKFLNSISKFECKKKVVPGACFQKSSVTHLTIFGWPDVDFHRSKRKNLDKLVTICGRILGVVGQRLQSLHFLESSPIYLLEAVAIHCPMLSSLTIEGKQSNSGVVNFKSHTLKELCLRDSGINLTARLNFPSLERFEYIDKVNPHVCETEMEVRTLIASIPPTIRELEILVGASCTNILFPLIASTFHSLEILIVHFSNGNALPQDIDANSIQSLAEGCPHLSALEIVDGFVDIASDATKLLAKFSNLRRLKLFYNETIADELQLVLQHSKSIKEITLLENEEDLYNESGSSEMWDEIEDSLRQISCRFPGVTIGIMDCWWV